MPMYCAKQQIARATLVLPNAGAFDTTPLVMQCDGAKWMTLFFRFTRGALNGEFTFKTEFSIDGGTTWYRSSLSTATNPVVPGSDAEDLMAFEIHSYKAQGASEELFSHGPIQLEDAYELVRINAQESGTVGTPGTLGIIAVFSE